MGLNLKAAILICSSFISGLCLYVSRVALPATPVPLPATAPQAGAPPAPPAAAEATPREDRNAVALAAGPKFSRHSPFDSPAAPRRSEGEKLPAADLPRPPEGARAVVLPPLRPPTRDDTAVVDGPVAPIDGAPAPGGDVATAPGGHEPAPSVAGAAPDDARAANVAPPVATEPRRYKVARGDSLTRIATRELKSSDRRVIELLLEANPKVRKRQGQILANEELVIPAPAVVERVLKGEKPAVALAAPPQASTPPKTASTSKAAARGSGKDKQPDPAGASVPPTVASAGSNAAPSGPAAGRGKPKSGGAEKVAPAPAGNKKGSRPPRGTPSDRDSRSATVVVNAGGSDKKPAKTGGSKPAARGGKPSPAVAKDATPESSKPRWYTVQKSDSLQSIAKRCLNDERRWREIAELNGLRKPNQVNSGTRLKIPPTIATARG